MRLIVNGGQEEVRLNGMLQEAMGLQVCGGVSSSLTGLFISDFEVAKVRVAVISVIACHHE